MNAKEFKEVLSKKEEEILFLHKQLREMKELAEKYGSEIASYKHKSIRLEEELERLKNKR